MTVAPLSIAFVVLHTSPLDEPGTKDAGGMNVVIRSQAAELARLGHRVQLITRRSAPDTADTVELEDGVVVHHLSAGPARLLAKGEHEALMPAFGDALAAHLAGFPADVLHAEHWFSGIAALPVARSLKIPLVQSFHSIAADPHSPLSEGERPESSGRLAGEIRLAHESDLVIAVSEAEAATVRDRLGGAPARIRVVPLGVDAELFHPNSEDSREKRNAWFTAGGRPEVLVAGRLHPLKGFDLAVEALAAIPADQRPSLRIVGAPPPDGDDYARALHRAVDEHGLLSLVSFDGSLRRGEFAERLREATLVLVPSHSETFGLVALEAAATGVPVIARATGGLHEAVLDGVTGVLVASPEPEVWAATISELLGDQERLERYGAAAREHGLRMSWAASAEQLLRVYRELLGTQSR